MAVNAPGAGFKLTAQGRHLMRFIGYCEARGADHVTAELALAWAIATATGSGDQVYHGRRLMVARIFARYLQVPVIPISE